MTKTTTRKKVPVKVSNSPTLTPNKVIQDPSYAKEHRYEDFLVKVKTAFGNQHVYEQPLFTTDAEGLFDLFLANLPEQDRQHYTCNSCRKFFENFGGLVTINSSGISKSAVWPDVVPTYFQKAVTALANKVICSKVTGVFLSTETTWGVPSTGEWEHVSVFMPEATYKTSSIKTAYEAMAEKREDFNMLTRALHDFDPTVVAQALRVLDSDTLYRSEKVLGVAKWLDKLHSDRAIFKSKVDKDRVTWLAVATAPAGFCHVRSSMIGTLLEDIEAGRSFEQISSRFKEKMNPSKYQRPSAAPSAGTVVQAEKILAQLNAEGSLARRFARLEECVTLWTPDVPEAPEKAEGGVFSHLATKPPKKSQVRTIPPVTLPQITMTWEKFKRTLLDDAVKIEYLTPRANTPGPFSGILTAVNSEAPPILQWDQEDARNPFSWYFWNGIVVPQHFSLLPASWVEVTAVCPEITSWATGVSAPNQDESVFFLLKGAKDIRTPTLCLFPEILKSEFHPIRSVIEAYSNSNKVEGALEASALGIRLGKSRPWDVILRVHTEKGIQQIKLDRWD